MLPLVYEELRVLAESYMRGERRDHTLQATALVHEAYLNLAKHSQMSWQNRSHFLAMGALAMRRALINLAVQHGRLKRGGDWQRVTLNGELLGQDEMGPEELLSLDEALNKLARAHPRQAQVVELRFFSGMGNSEVAEVLEMSSRTVERDWDFAQAWLRREMAGETEA